MKKELEFPRTYTTSSAAYRVIRQLKAKGDKRDFRVNKISDKVFELSVTMTIEEMKEKRRDVTVDNVSYRYFPDGVNGEGYYELKTGNRRRPNSMFLSVAGVYQEYLFGLI